MAIYYKTLFIPCQKIKNLFKKLDRAVGICYDMRVINVTNS